MRSSRKLEQRVREDLGLRYLAGGGEPDPKTICEFVRRPGRGVNDLFTAGLEQLQRAGMGKLGVVAVDSTRVKAHASRQRGMTAEGLRGERAGKRRQVREWEQGVGKMDPEENPGGVVAERERVRQRLTEIPGELQKLHQSGLKKLSRTDEDSRFLRRREGFVLGYTADAVGSEDGLVVGVRVTQAAHDHASLVPMIEPGEPRCGKRPEKVLGDAGFYSNRNVEAMAQRGLELYVPDSVLARAMKPGQGVRAAARIWQAGLQRMRQRLRSPAGRKRYARRQGMIEPVFGTLPEQRGMRGLQRRGLEAVNIEFTLMALAYNLTRLQAGLQG